MSEAVYRVQDTHGRRHLVVHFDRLKPYAASMRSQSETQRAFDPTLPATLRLRSIAITTPVIPWCFWRKRKTNTQLCPLTQTNYQLVCRPLVSIRVVRGSSRPNMIPHVVQLMVRDKLLQEVDLCDSRTVLPAVMCLL